MDQAQTTNERSGATPSAVGGGSTPRPWGHGTLARFGSRLPLRWNIQLSASVLLIALVAAILTYVNYQANRFVNAGLAADLHDGQELLLMLRRDRQADLRLTAELVASFPALRALLQTDAATVRDFLIDYQGRNERVDVLIALDPARRVISRTDSISPTPLPGTARRWLEPLSEGRATNGAFVAGSTVYDAAAVPAEAGGVVFGFILTGARVDDALARTIRDAIHQEVVILGADRVLGSTLDRAVLPWKSARDRPPVGSRASPPERVYIAGQTYAALEAPGAESEPRIITLQSRDQALAPYRRLQFGLLLLGLVAAGAGLAGSALLARTLTAPVAQLAEGTREVARGNLAYRLEVDRGDEIGDLARSFNTMVQGLRERADMQKFVSQSTVAMIQTKSDARVVAGERRIVTVFFSDVRGFTTMAEQRPPEETVRLLNRCLSLQAERVRKFGGDVDKYVGDAVVAVFSGEDMALDAIRCAVDINRALDELNGTVPPDEVLRIGIGIVTGEVILGSIGGGDRLDYTVIGSNVNLCERLCSNAAPGEILLAEPTYARVRDLVAAERLPPLVVKGFSEPVPTYRMVVRG